jgi:hypothetical protein
MLKTKDMVQRLRRARILVNEVYAGTDIPQIQSIMRHADQNLHWALWNLGEIDELRPDLPGSVKPARAASGRRAASAKRKARK